MRALIIEDEARAREHMKNLLAQHFPSTEVSGAVGSVSDAVQWLESNPDPDVIFMDVELSDGISFDIFNKVEINSPVIITIRLNDRIVPVRVSDIAYFYSEDKNTYMVTVSGTSYVLDDSLDALVESLDPESFFRISRSCIMSEQSIDSISKLMGGRLRISVRPGTAALTDFTVSRARVDGFMKWLEK